MEPNDGRRTLDQPGGPENTPRDFAGSGRPHSTSVAQSALSKEVKPKRPSVAYPVGRCYCCCQTELTDPRGFFVPGHDKRAEAQVIRDRYGNVANFLIAHGYGPDGPPRRVNAP
jgi:hypothetical protein